MTKREAIDVLQKEIACEQAIPCPAKRCPDCEFFEDKKNVIKAYRVAIEALIRMDELEHADGCVGCAFAMTEPWGEPCAHCKRNTMDRWRRAE